MEATNRKFTTRLLDMFGLTVGDIDDSSMPLTIDTAAAIQLSNGNRALAYKVPLDAKDDTSLSLEDEFSMHVEYNEYDFDLFQWRFTSLRRIICALNAVSEFKPTSLFIIPFQVEKIFCPTDNFGNDIWSITVDGVHYWIQEPTRKEFSKDLSYFWTLLRTWNI